MCKFGCETLLLPSSYGLGEQVLNLLYAVINN